jgi:hypothetical protein
MIEYIATTTPSHCLGSTQNVHKDGFINVVLLAKSRIHKQASISIGKTRNPSKARLVVAGLVSSVV